MIEEFSNICEFHEKMKLGYSGPERAISREYVDFRSRFMLEELGEYMDAVVRSDPAKMLDALVDLCYVGIGTLYLHGFRPRPWLMSPLHTLSFSPLSVGRDPHTGTQIFELLSEGIERYRRSAILLTPQGLIVAREGLHEVIFGSEYAARRIHLFQFEMAWKRVHAANMLKERRATARSGEYDVAKPEGWSAPDLSDLV